MKNSLCRLIAAFAAFLGIAAAVQAASTIIPVTLDGLPRARADLNLHLLDTEAAYFDPATTAFPKSGWISAWPGDTSGRLLLGLCRAYETTGTKSAKIDQLIARLPAQLNREGYMGEPLPEGVMDEQYLAGNGWLIRGLCAHYRIWGDAESLTLLRRVLEGLLPRALVAFPRYPATRTFAHDGEPGQLSKIGVVDGWRLTNDVGSGFMFIDAATDAYELVPSTELARLIDIIVHKVSEYDVVKVRAQTHATLTICRGLLRHFRHTGDKAVLARIIEIWTRYREEAMTEDYENWVWFGRPEWTEGCAVVDSFEVAMELWRTTGSPLYLNDAQLIWHNAIRFNQWPNGGFGACSCAGAKDTSTITHLFEAPWCCSMRGAEGFHYLQDAVLAVDGNELTWQTLVPHHVEFPFAGKKAVVRVDTNFPLGEKFSLVLEDGGLASATLRFYLPVEWLRARIKAHLNGREVAVKREGDFIVSNQTLAKGDRLDLSIPLGIRPAASVTSSKRAWHRFMHGPLLLAVPGSGSVSISRDAGFFPLGAGCYRVSGSDVVLLPLAEISGSETQAITKESRQVLFRNGPEREK